MLYARRSLPVACLALFLVCAVLFRDRVRGLGQPFDLSQDAPHATPSAATKEANENGSKKEARCASLKSSGLNDVAIVLKTGATEIYEKLPIHFTTTFECIDNYLIYSDVAQSFGDATIEDALSNITRHIVLDAEDLKQYAIINEHVSLGGDAAELRGEKSWNMDKYKFLPMISDAYRTFGDSKRWYMFMEADTYVSLHNLLLWLDELDHQMSVYAGAQVIIGNTEFGHGGSGFLLSSFAAKAVSDTYLREQEHWDDWVAHSCCGDMVLAEVLMTTKPPTNVLRAFPSIQGETLTSLDWSDTHWCKPAITWHHVDTAGVDKLWQFDRTWRANQHSPAPILFRDYYKHFVHPRLVAANGSLPAWDNLSDDWAFSISESYHISVESAMACEQLCHQQRSCLQWAWRPGSCRAGKKVRLGWALKNRPALGSAEDRLENPEGKSLEGAVSGWMLERIEKFKAAQEPCGEAKMWITRNE